MLIFQSKNKGFLKKNMVQGPTFLSLTAWRQVSEPWLTKAITGPKSRGTSFGTALWHHVQRYCFNRISFAHAQLPSYFNRNLCVRSSKLTILMLEFCSEASCGLYSLRHIRNFFSEESAKKDPGLRLRHVTSCI